MPVFADASAGFSAPGWAYAGALQTALQYLPLLLGVAAIAILGAAAFGGGR